MEPEFAAQLIHLELAGITVTIGEQQLDIPTNSHYNAGNGRETKHKGHSG